MHLDRATLCGVLIIAAALFLPVGLSVGQESIPVTDSTITIQESGALHYKVLQTTKASRDGVTNYYFELQKTSRPENVSIYDPATGKPLQYVRKDKDNVVSYQVNFDRPYFDGYTFAIEYDCHNRIIDEGHGVYSFGVRYAADIYKVKRINTVVFPEVNFTYLDYNHALDKPASVEEIDGRTTVRFQNTTSPSVDYAWEVKFRAIGIKDELKTPQSGNVSMPWPGFLGALTALLAGIWLRRE